MAELLSWAIIAAAIGGVILRPFGVAEVIPAVGGAVLLVVCGLLPAAAAWRGVAQGGNVYLFLGGMMLLAELARAEGVFGWVAAHAVRLARGSATRLFTLVYLVGAVVTVFLSNDATAVVLTPAVAAVVRQVKAKNPLPYLLICAFVANAASFVLPISNPANLVIYGSHMPDLLAWLRRFGLAAGLATGATYVLLRVTQRAALRQPLAAAEAVPGLPRGGRITGRGIILMAVLLLLASGFGIPLGWPTALAGGATAAVVMGQRREAPWGLLGKISWSTLLLVAGLFVMVQALAQTGVVAGIAGMLRQMEVAAPGVSVWGGGIGLGLASNLMNNLPAGLIAGQAAQAAGASGTLRGGLLIGVDLGPNLSVTGSLATILWLQALKREGLEVSFGQFLRLGLVVMPPALLLGLLGLMLTR